MADRDREDAKLRMIAHNSWTSLEHGLEVMRVSKHVNIIASRVDIFSTSTLSGSYLTHTMHGSGSQSEADLLSRTCLPLRRMMFTLLD